LYTLKIHRKIEICEGVRALGLDGFSKGWVAVLLDGDLREIRFCRNVAEALSIGFDRAAIDIPIGMTDDGERACDLLARERLRPHSSRVFTGARRWLWTEFSDPDRANRDAVLRGQKRVSRQLWHLGPKIMEADAYVRANRSHDIREAHPELVFLRLNAGKPLPPKKSEEGLRLRRRLLKREGIGAIDKWLTNERIGTGAKCDDVLDACAVAIAARDVAGCVPEGRAPRDAYGLPMQIWS
jgi:predicted RNase H-like nuclease